MTEPDIKTLIRTELPHLIAQDPQIRDFILRTVSDYYAGKQETDNRFDRILNELQRDREEQARKWAEQHQISLEQDRKWAEQRQISLEQDQKWAEQRQISLEQDRKWAEQRQISLEQDRKWAEQSRRWEEQDRKWHETLAEIRRIDKRFDSTIGALGSRWGLYSEASFRNALKGILEESFGVQVLNINDFDEAGEVFGRPDQVEIDIIIKNGEVMACEIKSSISKPDIYSFNRKVAFYQKRHQRPVTRKMIISPMVDQRAIPVAEDLGIEVYSYAEGVEGL
ncbi:DUF3782 domain-containing protein [Thermosynechococcaceae cyanobacterium BACA0444]|uniref:DUF3782 domain-containing protein n=1 Tax=Pseudocalidococcus azoricus BACA0444 TaxID=2918990 RepID=A0AAE4JYF5_9CYAN|nr:DUF3782 domain-containing protein [Pseudocalidococcus azoricus]MDS3859647.1 DUF3782 domain-containing protein [Pseudocalidococcus azoricus BACA0444]